MAASSWVLIWVTAALLVLSHSTLISGEEPTAYDLLQGYNFPPGLLPKGVTHYDLDTSTGKFHAFLDGTCSFSLEGSYKLKYKSTISGTITTNRIKDLKGISVQILFLWVNIVEVVRDGDELLFSVGIASASFGIENFEICPQCGCGLNCHDKQQVSRIPMRRPFVSSI
uniref:Uncharacterized protein n=1 Tax=Kalanchoe fedtschenkoi TaxID=63787 RepID=A0A7N0TLM8_KALFE